LVLGEDDAAADLAAGAVLWLARSLPDRSAGCGIEHLDVAADREGDDFPAADVADSRRVAGVGRDGPLHAAGCRIERQHAAAAAEEERVAEDGRAGSAALTREGDGPGDFERLELIFLEAGLLGRNIARAVGHDAEAGGDDGLGGVDRALVG